ncbi:hypothetical protein GCM10028812_53820 [Ancylobacter sonchi]
MKLAIFRYTLIGHTDEAEALVDHDWSQCRATVPLDLAKLLTRAGRAEAAEAVLHRALDAFPEHPELLLALGRRQFANQQYAEAIETFERAIQTTGSPTDAWIGLASVIGRASSMRLAKDKLTGALTVKGDDPALHVALANQLLSMGFLDEAEKVTFSAKSRFMNDTAIKRLYIRLHIISGRFDEAAVAISTLPNKTYKDIRRNTYLTASLLKEQWRVDEVLSLYKTPNRLETSEYRLLADVRLMALDVAGARSSLGEAYRRIPQRRMLNVSQGLAGEILNDFWTDSDALSAGQAAREHDTLHGWVETVRANRHHTGCAMGFMIYLRQSGVLSEKECNSNYGSITRHIHQFWDTLDIPDDVSALMKEWKISNPDWTYTCHSLSSVREWLQGHPDQRLVRAFRQTTSVAGKADLLRLAILFDAGGVYVDADDRCVAPLDAFLKGRELVLRQEHYGSIGNNFIAVRPHHPVIGQALDQALTAVLRGDRESIWLSTGPGLLTRVLASYITDDPSRLEALGREIIIFDRPNINRFCVSGCRVSYKYSEKNWQAREFRKPESRLTKL